MAEYKKSALMSVKSIHRTNLDGPVQGAGRMKIPFQPTPERPMIISASEIAEFLRCRLKWNWHYRVGITSRKYAMPRAVGTWVHLGKEAWYTLPREQRTAKKMKSVAEQAIREARMKGAPSKDRDLALAMLTGYAMWVRGNHDKSDKAIGKKIVMPEWEFSLPLLEDGSVLVRGKIDELFEPTIYKNTLAMDETKTRSTIEFDMLDMSAQMTVYLWAMSEHPLLKKKKYRRFLGWRTVMRRQMPGPRVKAPLFGREFVERTDEELQMWLRDTRRTVKDMVDAAIYPNKTDRCKFDCDFYNLCLVRPNLTDLKEVIKSEYVIT
jgi:hypothetical protein